jgi:hypothetical protein
MSIASSTKLTENINDLPDYFDDISMLSLFIESYFIFIITYIKLMIFYLKILF